MYCIYYIYLHRSIDSKLKTLSFIHTDELYAVDKNMSYEEMFDGMRIMHFQFDTISSLSYKQIIKAIAAYTPNKYNMIKCCI